MYFSVYKGTLTLHSIAHDGVSVTNSSTGNAVTSVTIADGKSITVAKEKCFAEAYGNNTSCVQYSTQADKLNSSCLDSSLYYKKESNGATSDKLGISFGEVSLSNTDKAVKGCDVQNAIDKALDEELRDIPTGGETMNGYSIYYYANKPGDHENPFAGCTPAIVFYSHYWTDGGKDTTAGWTNGNGFIVIN